MGSTMILWFVVFLCMFNAVTAARTLGEAQRSVEVAAAKREIRVLRLLYVKTEPNEDREFNLLSWLHPSERSQADKQRLLVLQKKLDARPKRNYMEEQKFELQLLS